ncbi:MAG: hypothetical protein A2Z32_09485 [Chloroflexi bacterium RBG_16_69_14]|nr:MAG: hypothetical protein A2Z32_09485 [Chloroflexi bacterium RBG_16_69_14]
MSAMRPVPPLPSEIADIVIPQDDTAASTWRWAHRALPDYLLTHSVRAYCWGAVIGAGEGLTFDRQVLWTASLMHDVGLTRIPKNTTQRSARRRVAWLSSLSAATTPTAP